MTVSINLYRIGRTAIGLIFPHEGTVVASFDNGVMLADDKYSGSRPLVSHSLKVEAILVRKPSFVLHDYRYLSLRKSLPAAFFLPSNLSASSISSFSIFIFLFGGSGNATFCKFPLPSLI